MIPIRIDIDEKIKLFHPVCFFQANKNSVITIGNIPIIRVSGSPISNNVQRSVISIKEFRKCRKNSCREISELSGGCVYLIRRKRIRITYQIVQIWTGPIKTKSAKKDAVIGGSAPSKTSVISNPTALTGKDWFFNWQKVESPAVNNKAE